MQVTVSDSGLLTDVQDIAVTVTDINEAPSVALMNTTSSLVENTDTSSRIKVANVVVTDDALGTNTLSLNGVDAVMFEIDSAELFLKAGSTVDFETNPILDVTVEVDDSTVGMAPDDFAALVINVIDVDAVTEACGGIIDQAIAEIDVLLLDPGLTKKAKDKLEKAKKDLNKAFDKMCVDGDIKKGIKEIGDAVKDLLKAEDEGAPVAGLIGLLVDSTRAIAQEAIDAAIAGGGDQNDIDKALDEMAKAQLETRP